MCCRWASTRCCAASTVRAGRALAPSAPGDRRCARGQARGRWSRTTGDLITVIRDELGIFQRHLGRVPGYRAYQPIAAVAPPGQILSAAGTQRRATPSIVGYRLGRGIVVDIGLAGFGSSLAANVDARSCSNRLLAR